ncbi:MAG: hypothetical protein JST16_01590 [Bdellovibrionales bacterium]|nr:hypothetical protein [Bdellovibrionales bacterium]
MAGLARICKMYGGMEINGKKYVWDYARDEAVPEDEMPTGSERHRDSEKAKFKALQQEIDAVRPAT